MVTKLYEHALIGWDATHQHHQRSTAGAAAFVIPANHNIGSGNNGLLLQRRAFGTTTSSSSSTATTNGGHYDDYQRHTNKNWGVGMMPSSSSTNGCTSTSLRAFSSSSSQPTTPSTSSQSTSQSSKLSSSRANHAISLLPSYLIDARAITKYCKHTAPSGALQLSVAENQLCELSIDGVSGIVEGNVDNNGEQQGGDNGGVGSNSKNMTLVQVLSQLASSTTNRPTSGLSCGEDGTTCFATDMIYYQPTQGSPGLRASMVDYLDTLLLKSSSSSSSSSLSSKKRTFNDDNIILGAGCNAVLENLCMCLCEPGDAVMIPTPYYAAFEFDLVARAGCEIVPVNTLDFHESPPPSSSGATTIPPSFYYPNKASLTHAYNRSIEQTSRPPRVLLLSHPNNPLGICYPPEVMTECIEWCREHEVHLISDEIYAGSVYREKKMEEKNDGGEEKDTFVSAMSLASGHEEGDGGEKGGLGLGPYIHLVYALSKDFALSGLRVGVAYTENEEILLPMQKLNDLCQISSQTQLLVERMLSAHVAGSGNEKFVDVYLKSNRNNIRTRCDKLQQCLTDMDIPYLPADSGLFVWMDFREFLPELEESITEETESLSSKEHRERQLYLKLMKDYGLLFTPGMSMRNERAGFFRCVFTAASEEEFELGLERIRTFVKEQREG